MSFYQISPQPYGYMSLVRGRRAKAISVEMDSGVLTLTQPQGVYLNSATNAVTIRFYGRGSVKISVGNIRSVSVYFSGRPVVVYDNLVDFFSGEPRS